MKNFVTMTAEELYKALSESNYDFNHPQGFNIRMLLEEYRDAERHAEMSRMSIQAGLSRSWKTDVQKMLAQLQTEKANKTKEEYLPSFR